MSHIFGTDVDFNSNEAKKFRVENLLNFPSVGAGDVGRIFSHTGQQTFYGWNGSAWLDLALAGGGGGGSQSWQETVIVGNAITSVDTVGSFLEINRYANAIDIDLHDSDYTNNVYLYAGNSADGDSPGFSMDGDADDSNSWFTVDAGGIIDLKARSSSLLLFASQTYNAEAQKRYAGLTLDIDDMTLYSFNPNTNQGGTLTFNGTNERVHLIHKNGNAIENTLSIAKPTSGNSLTILPALNLPFGNNKYIPLFFTDGVTTVEASATGLVNISTITGGGGGGDMLASVYDPIINANTAKVSNVDHPLVETAVPVGAVFTDTVYDDTTIQAEVDLNTAKVGITAQQASDITANNAKISYTDASLVATHTTDISNINTAQGVQDSAIALNTAKVGVTNEEENTINSIVAGEPTGADVVPNVVSLTQAEYDAGTPIAGTQYNITDALPGGSGEVNTINSVLTGEPAGSLVIPNIVKITQADYDAGTPVATTFYAII